MKACEQADLKLDLHTDVFVSAQSPHKLQMMKLG